MTRAEHDEEELLAALANGSLSERELAEQRRARDLIRSAAAQIEAPASLRERLAAQRAELDLRGRRRLVQFPRPAVERGARLAWLGGLAAAAAALILAVVLPSGTPGAPSVVEAAVLTQRPAADPAPPIDARTPTLLRVRVEDTAFPAWQAALGWRATGARKDELDGRAATTVFYEKGGKRIGYTIAAGDALEPPGGRIVTRQGIRLRVFRSDGRTAVTWLRDGHSCILAGAGVPTDILLELAAWNGKGTVTV